MVDPAARTCLDGATPEAILDMVWIPGGTFRMGSDKHYPEEAPVHHVRVDGFFIDRHPVTTDLRGAYLRVARLDGADLSAADLRHTQGLVGAQLAAALCLTDARLPVGLSAEG
jgi:hypothetical protein